MANWKKQLVSVIGFAQVFGLCTVEVDGFKTHVFSLFTSFLKIIDLNCSVMILEHYFVIPTEKTFYHKKPDHLLIYLPNA